MDVGINFSNVKFVLYLYLDLFMWFVLLCATSKREWSAGTVHSIWDADALQPQQKYVLQSIRLNEINCLINSVILSHVSQAMIIERVKILILRMICMCFNILKFLLWQGYGHFLLPVYQGQELTREVKLDELNLSMVISKITLLSTLIQWPLPKPRWTSYF